MLPGFNLSEFVSVYGALTTILVIASIIFAESGLLIGFFLPGDSLLFTAGFLAYSGVINFDIHLMVAIFFVAAVVGDSFGYIFGYKVGRRIFERPNTRLFKKEHLLKAEHFYEKYGPITIVIARFTPVIRTFAPIVAGAARMHYRTFLIYNIIGALLWAVGITYLGYYLGSGLRKLGIDLEIILIPAILIIVGVSLAPPVVHVLQKNPDTKKRFKDFMKQIKILFVGD